ncbi:DNA pilot protein [Dipodfec virus UOA04_Rod_462]|nr:DNA pilot protein [Dipodfec virus UOA04_Rod_462]
MDPASLYSSLSSGVSSGVQSGANTTIRGVVSNAITNLAQKIPVIGGLFKDNSARDAMKWQSKLKEMDQAFTREMYDLEYQRNMEMWEKNNAYNSPAALRARLESAGLNADLMYGGGPGALATPAASPAKPSNMAGSQDASYVAQANLTASQARLANAQANNLDADTRQKDKNTDWIDRLNEAGIGLTHASTFLTNAQRNEVNTRISELNQKIALLRNEVDQIPEINRLRSALASKYDYESLVSFLDAQFKQATFKEAVRKFAAETDMAETEARLAAARIYSQILLNQSGVNLNNAQAGYYDAQTQDLKATIESLGKKFGDMSSVRDILTNLDVIMKGASALSSFINPLSNLWSSSKSHKTTNTTNINVDARH